MKQVLIAATAAVVIGFYGCGGGGGGGSSSGGGDALSNDDVNTFVASTSEQLGCMYTPTAAAELRSMLTPESLGVLGKIKALALAPDSSKSAVKLRATETETVYGDCGGSMKVTTNEGSSSMSMTMEMNDYCTEEYTGETTTIDGKLSIGMSESGTSLVMTASTSGAVNVVTLNPNTGETVDVSLTLDSGRLVMNEDESMSVTAKKVTVKDNTANETYTVSNLSLTSSANGDVSMSATFVDPQMGSVAVSANGNAEDPMGMAITMSSGGSTAVIAPINDNGLFSVTNNGTRIGTMDCSMVDNPLEGLL